ncbi:MAG TPA: hypothetical protein VGL60_11295 [Acidimicrobiales bacterium]
MVHDSPAPTRLIVVAWPDGDAEPVGHDPRSRYVERFWLPVIGPSATWLIRRLADGLDAAPGGYPLDLVDVARTLGLGAGTSGRSPVRRALQRCARFDLLRLSDPRTIEVRRRVPPLLSRHVRLLPGSLRAEHRAWDLAQGDGAAPPEAPPDPPVGGPTNEWPHR